VNTVGFKTARLDFKDALYTAGITPGPAYTPEGNLQKGHGVMTAAIVVEYSTGALKATDAMLDFSREGDAFFQLRDPAGNLQYTRAGNFYTSEGTTGLELVNAQGYFVTDDNGQRIVVPDGTTDIAVSDSGLLSFRQGETNLGTAQLGMYSFANTSGLTKVGNTNFKTTVASGPAERATQFHVNQYMLENSNVDMATEMTRLLRTQRAFSFASRALTTADDMEGIANNMRR
jgi:flagellar basal body rod protein FlgG